MLLDKFRLRVLDILLDARNTGHLSSLDHLTNIMSSNVMFGGGTGDCYPVKRMEPVEVLKLIYQRHAKLSREGCLAQFADQFQLGNSTFGFELQLYFGDLVTGDDILEIVGDVAVEHFSVLAEITAEQQEVIALFYKRQTGPDFEDEDFENDED